MQSDFISQALRLAVKELELAGAEFAVIGGLAVAARTEPRFTQDVDFAVAVKSDEEAEALCGHLVRCGFRVHGELDHKLTGRMATMRMIPPLPRKDLEIEIPIVDLLFWSCGIEPEVVAAATPLEVLPGCEVPTAGIAHLIAMKLISARPERRHDESDLIVLARAATDEDLKAVPNLLSLIRERGRDQGLDLGQRFARVLQIVERD